MNRSGSIHLDGDIIRYRSAVYGEWDLPTADVRVIGESTNQSGPFSDDYFFCFATGPEMWREASFYAAGVDGFLLALGARLGCRLDVGLCSSTDFASRILWPPSLAGEPMFRYEEVRPTGLIGRLVGDTRIRTTYSLRVAAVLAGDDRSAASGTGRTLL